MRFLEIVQIFEAKWSEKIKEEKFKLYNNDLINQIVEVQAKLQLMSEYIEKGGLYEDGVSLETLVRRFNLTEEQIRGNA